MKNIFSIIADIRIIELLTICCALIFILFVLTSIFWRKTGKLTYGRIVAHETGHVLFLLAFNPLPKNILLIAVPNKGFLNWSFDYEDKDRPAHTRQLRMLLCLGGYLSERMFFGNEYRNGNLKDLEQWYDLYNRHVLETNIKINEFLITYTAYKFRKQQEKIAREFLSINNEIYYQIYELLLSEKILRYDDLIDFQKSIKFPQDGFLAQNGK